jgi:hypothetical protein
MITQAAAAAATKKRHDVSGTFQGGSTKKFKTTLNDPTGMKALPSPSLSPADETAITTTTITNGNTPTTLHGATNATTKNTNSSTTTNPTLTPLPLLPKSTYSAKVQTI